MTDLILKTFEHAPSLAAMLLLVWFFLKFLERLLKSHAERTTEFVSTVKDLAHDNSEARERSASQIEKNIAATSENTSTLKAMTRAIENLERSTDRNTIK
jgi:uncharacterized membrane protein YhiD involved in acid resistance